jgi:bifunctional DNA-binding transcriptional regulator/antitoxin component of YhaV-PrlF toxin-antitoxin module
VEIMGALALSKPVERTGQKERTRHTEPKELRIRMRMGEKGRFVIPAAMREALGMNVGDVIILRMVDGELRIATRESRLRRVREWARQNIPPGVSLADELNAERREAAKHE